MNLVTEKQLQFLRDVLLDDMGIEDDTDIVAYLTPHIKTPITYLEELTAEDCSTVLTKLRP